VFLHLVMYACLYLFSSLFLYVWLLFVCLYCCFLSSFQLLVHGSLRSLFIQLCLLLLFMSLFIDCFLLLPMIY